MLNSLGNFFRAYPNYALLLASAGAVLVLINLIIISLMRSRFKTQQEFNITRILWLSTLFCFVLIACRIQLSGSSGRIFMIWNLFLAWIPYWLTLLLKNAPARLLRRDRFAAGSEKRDFYEVKNKIPLLAMQWFRLRLLLLLVVWLAFFPNAPYMITDLQYLAEPSNTVPYWFDIIMMLSFAWAGMMLGYFSLYKVQQYLRQLTNPVFSWLATLAILVGASYGIFLGRYQRWNSWDLVVQPVNVIQDILATLTTPRAIGMTLVLSTFLMLGYLTLTLLIPDENRR